MDRQTEGDAKEKNNNYWRDEIVASKGDSRRMWWTFGSVLGKIYTADTDMHMADDFAVPTSTTAMPLYGVLYRSMPTIVEWSDETSDKVEKLSSSMKCLADPAMWLMKDMHELLSLFVSLLFSKSLTTGCVPQEFKEGVFNHC